MLEATTTVTAEASSMLKPLKLNKVLFREVYQLECFALYSRCCLILQHGCVFIPRRSDRGQVLAHGLDDSTAPDPQTDTDAHSSIQQQPDWSWCT